MNLKKASEVVKEGREEASGENEKSRECEFSIWKWRVEGSESGTGGITRN